MKGKRTILALLFALALAVGLFLGDVFRTPQSGFADPAQRHELRKGVKELQDFADKLGTLFQRVAEYASPTVVAISSERTVRYRSPGVPSPFGDPWFDRFFEDDPFFKRFFGPQERQFRRESLGSGFIFDEDGYILTNNHVVEDADELKVRLSDGRTFKATVVGADRDMDIAVIKLKGDFGKLPSIELGDSDSVHVGQWVIAIGNPFGLKHTVSAGIVSAKGRTGMGISKYESWIQTDAAINRGNSGGPLVNLKGEVIGINTAIVSSSGGNVGVGFAIPINMAKSVLPELKRGEKVVRGYLGIVGKNLTPELAAGFDYEGTEGALVDEVTEGTPAARARPVGAPGVAPGLKAGDIITEYDGKKIRSFEDLFNRVGATRPGSSVKLKVWRKGKELTFTVTVERRDEMLAEGTWRGIRVESLTEQKGLEFGRRGLKGVLVAEVAPDSPARGILSPGDLILSINRQTVQSVEEFRRLIARTSPEEAVLVRFYDRDRGYARFEVIPGE